MTIEILPSGKYRISEMRNRKRLRVILDHEPSEKEAKKIFDAMENKITNATPFKNAAEKYVDSKSNILSPSSIRGYKIIIRHLPEQFLNTRLDCIDLPCVQSLVNSLATYQAPKTVRNTNAFIMSVLKFYGMEV